MAESGFILHPCHGTGAVMKIDNFTSVAFSKLFLPMKGPKVGLEEFRWADYQEETDKRYDHVSYRICDMVCC
jgi:hypothetical protein